MRAHASLCRRFPAGYQPGTRPDSAGPHRGRVVRSRSWPRVRVFAIVGALDRRLDIHLRVNVHGQQRRHGTTMRSGRLRQYSCRPPRLRCRWMCGRRTSRRNVQGLRPRGPSPRAHGQTGRMSSQVSAPKQFPLAKTSTTMASIAQPSRIVTGVSALDSGREFGSLQSSKRLDRRLNIHPGVTCILISSIANRSLMIIRAVAFMSASLAEPSPRRGLFRLPLGDCLQRSLKPFSGEIRHALHAPANEMNLTLLLGFDYVKQADGAVRKEHSSNMLMPKHCDSQIGTTVRMCRP